MGGLEDVDEVLRVLAPVLVVLLVDPSPPAGGVVIPGPLHADFDGLRHFDDVDRLGCKDPQPELPFLPFVLLHIRDYHVVPIVFPLEALQLQLLGDFPPREKIGVLFAECIDDDVAVLRTLPDSIPFVLVDHHHEIALYVPLSAQFIVLLHQRNVDFGFLRHFHSELRVVEPLFIGIQVQVLRFVLVFFVDVFRRTDPSGALPLPPRLDAKQRPLNREHFADEELVKVHMPIAELHPPGPVRFF